VAVPQYGLCMSYRASAQSQQMFCAAPRLLLARVCMCRNGSTATHFLSAFRIRCFVLQAFARIGASGRIGAIEAGTVLAMLGVANEAAPRANARAMPTAMDAAQVARICRWLATLIAQAAEVFCALGGKEDKAMALERGWYAGSASTMQLRALEHTCTSRPRTAYASTADWSGIADSADFGQPERSTVCSYSVGRAPYCGYRMLTLWLQGGACCCGLHRFDRAQRSG